MTTTTIHAEDELAAAPREGRFKSLSKRTVATI